MKDKTIRCSLRVAAVVAAMHLGCDLSAADTVKAAWFVRDISCKVGSLLAGYGPEDVSEGKLDDLQLHGLAMDDGRTKTLLMSFDLLGMDADLIRRMRHECAAAFGVEDRNVMFSCTHTHGGPHVRRYSKVKNYGTKPDPFAKAEDIDTEYVSFLEKATVDAVRQLASGGVWRECRVGFFSSQCDENRNRIYTTVENCATFIVACCTTSQRELRTRNSARSLCLTRGRSAHST